MHSDKMSYKEVSERYNVPLGTLYAWVSRKQIPHFRLGSKYVRFSKEQLDAWMEAHFVPPQGKRSTLSKG